MDSLGLTMLDIGVIVVFVLAGLVGLAMGFVRGGLFLASWIGAIAATVYGFSHAVPYARELIETEWIADISAGTAIFLVTLVILFIISSFIGSWVRKSRLNSLDRSLGMLAGLTSAVLLVCTAFLMLGDMWEEEEQPTWISEARSLGTIAAGADILRQLLPAGAFEAGVEAVGDAQKKALEKLDTDEMLREMLIPPPADRTPAEKEGYGQQERKRMERLIDGNQ